MANRPKGYRTKQRDDVEALMAALLTQIRAETTDAINLALRRHDERHHLPSIARLPGDMIYESGPPALYVPAPSPLVGLTGEPL